MIERALLERLYRTADAARWSVPAERFVEALQAGVSSKTAKAAPAGRDLERHFESLHLRDLALACACAAGNERAWEHFIAEYRPGLYRAADALDRSGGAREIADALYADLYGLKGEGDRRASLFKYFHGRSSLATWLRAVLAQRYVDQLRAGRRTTTLDEEDVAAIPAPHVDPERVRFSELVAGALRDAVARLAVKDRLRLRAYYEQDLTLAQVGRLTGEHEATVSRQLARTRKVLRETIDQLLRHESQLDGGEIARAIESVIDDAGTLDLRHVFGTVFERKIRAVDRSE